MERFLGLDHQAANGPEAVGAQREPPADATVSSCQGPLCSLVMSLEKSRLE